MPTLSLPESDGGSYARPHAGASVFSSCCAHHAVSLPSCLICERTMMSIPLTTAARAFARRAASTKL
jgi:hypothetical protein